ncbi:dynein regulatory complex subunit 7 [Plakobranchus ocellatus]|uniref:Dynein regulatory complex subunit 7 n=1 Tax=Plakobranchus ocellatus TaxID=259542 RepID=A0AAV4DKX7_9GAST|nr:dynein regulatory complex subunit 7 [Plakobranchus ocellatus]
MEENTQSISSPTEFDDGNSSQIKKQSDTQVLKAAKTSKTENESEGDTLLDDEIKNISLDDKAIKPIEEIFDPGHYPPSYKDNCEKEEKAIKYCKTFIKQYNFLYNKRPPLFIKPKNEFGVQNTGIVMLICVYDQPQTLYSPQTTLEKMHGHCFEMSTLLCSMLIGAGYNALVVSGYATREVCLQDLSYTTCPYVEENQKVYLPPKERKVCRYTPRAPRLFRSEYELRMKLVKQASEKAIRDAKKAEEDRARQV